jgi:hypothetical protein
MNRRSGVIVRRTRGAKTCIRVVGARVELPYGAPANDADLLCEGALASW